MVIRKLWIVCFCLVLLAGCSSHTVQVEGPEDERQEVEKALLNDNRIVAASAIVHDDQILAGIRVKTFARFNKRSIAKELQKELEEQYPDKEVFISPDNKVLYETAALMKEKDEDKLTEGIEKIIKLAKEET